MFKRQFLTIIVLTITALSFILVKPANTALETQLLVDVSPSPDNVPYTQTQWYGFTPTAGKGYCAILSPLTGNSNLYLFDNNFNRVGSSRNSGTTVDKVWYGQTTSGPMHIGCYGVYNPSSDFTIQVITAPYVKTISPTSGGAGTLVTLTGFGFGDSRGSNYVKFSTVTATSYYSWTNTQIKVYVPSGVAGGIIQVVVYVAGRASNPKNFTASGGSSEGTMWRYDLARTGNYPNGPTSLPLTLKWSYTIGGPSSLGTSPVTANGVIYLSSYDAYLYALNATDGTLKWKSTVRKFLDPPAVANGMVYAGGTDHKIYALDATTGAIKWSYEIGTSAYYESWASAPAVANGVVYIGMTTFLPEDQYQKKAKFYALDANTGALKWSYTEPYGYGNAFLTSPTIANNIVYIIPESDKVIALDANTGALKWSYATGVGRLTTPTVSNGVLYVVGIKYISSPSAKCKIAVCALDATTGTLKWSYLGGEVSVHAWSPVMSSSPAISGATLYFGGLYTEVYALDITTRTLKWSFSTGTTTDFAKSSPTFSNNTIYVGSPNGKFYAFDANTGALKWDYLLSAPDYYYQWISSSAAVANGRVYIFGGGKLYCFGQ